MTSFREQIPASAVLVAHKKTGYVVWTWKADGWLYAHGFLSRESKAKGRKPCFRCKQTDLVGLEECVARFFAKGAELTRRSNRAYDEYLLQTRYRPWLK